jgi:hypothetical protein
MMFVLSFFRYCAALGTGFNAVQRAEEQAWKNISLDYPSRSWIRLRQPAAGVEAAHSNAPLLTALFYRHTLGKNAKTAG